MKYLSENEEKALSLLNRENFKGLSIKDVMSLMSVIDQVEPDVAKAIISHIPESVKCTIETEKGYMLLLTKALESGDQGTQKCIDEEDKMVQSIYNELKKPNIDFKEKQFYYDKIEQANIRRDKKDTEKKDFMRDVLKFGGEALAIGIVATTCLFMGKAHLRIA